MHKILIALALVCLAVRAETVATVDVDGIAVPLVAASILPEDVRDADKAVARARLDYTPGKESITFLNANNHKIARPVESGYFRRTLGKTADGRIVVQDFWQDTATKRTAPFALTRRAAATNDHGGGIATLLPPLQAGRALGRALARLRAPDGADGLIDGIQVFYTRHGAVFLTASYLAGKQTGYSNLYDGGHLRMQIPASPDIDAADNDLPEFRTFAATHLRLFYPDGRLLALLPFSSPGETASGLALYYRADGSLLAADGIGDYEYSQLWDSAGAPLTDNTAAYEAALVEIKAVWQQMKALDDRLDQSRLELYHGVRHNAQGVRVVAVSGIDVPLRVDNTLPEAILDADKAAKAENISYIAGEAQTFYYDADGKKSAQPAPGGYFRKVVGKTADGRAVAQDFYQDSGNPQTALFILRANASADDFRTEMADSPVVTYGRDGAIFLVNYPVQADNITHRTGVYHEGRLLLQDALPAGKQAYRTKWRLF